MSTPTRSATNSLAKDSRLLMGNLAGARLRVNATPSATVVVVTSADELTGTSLYSSSAPGQLMVLSCAAGSTHIGKTADVNAISGTSLTVDVDFSAILAAGDIIAVVPPLSVELFLNGGHTLNAQLSNDYTMGLTETFDTHNTAMGVAVAGDVSLFQILNSETFARMLAFGTGSYKTPSGGTHKYRPIEANDGTFTALEDATFWSQDGNGVIREAFFGMFGTRLTLDFPEGATATASFSALGNGAIREIGGTGKTFTTGASNYIRTDFVCDTGPRTTFRAAFVELGGSFGDALTSAAETTVKNLSVSIERGAISDTTLGDAYIVKPEEDMFRLRVTGTRIVQTNTLHQYANGGSTDAEPGSGFKTETRMLIKAVSPNDPTKTLTIDIPRGVFSSRTTNRQRGRYTEQFEYNMLATLDGSGCVSTSTPPVEITLVSSVSKNLATAL